LRKWLPMTSSAGLSLREECAISFPKTLSVDRMLFRPKMETCFSTARFHVSMNYFRIARDSPGTKRQFGKSMTEAHL
jgi:hypothetical protein